MGLFDSLFKKVVNEIGDAISDAVDGSLKTEEKAEETTAGFQQTAEAFEENVNAETDSLSAEAKIAAALKEEFPLYEVRRNVSPTTIGGQGRFMNYSFGVYRGDSPVLFIMLVGKTTCGTRLYRWSKEQAAKAGVTLINFIEHYPNRPEYIKTRLHEYL